MTDLPLNVVYLRPDQPGMPVDYTRSLEIAGLIALPQRYLAMYTMGVGATGAPGANGATGPTGPTGPTWVNNICSLSDQYSDLVIDLVQPLNTFRSSFAMDLTNGHVRLSCKTAPVGASIIVDVHMNGTTIFDTLLSIDDGEKTSFTAAVPAVLNTFTVPEDAEFDVYLTQVGSTTPGTGLKIDIVGEYAG